MSEGWSAKAASMLDFAVDDPLQRALRTGAIYASLFEEDPLLHEWCGVAAWFAALQAKSLKIGVGFYDEIFARWNCASYDTVLPSLLAFRSGERLDGPFVEAFDLLIQAREVRKSDRPLCMSLARRGTDLLLALEQEFAVQPLFEGLPEIILRGLGPYVGLRFGEGELMVYEAQDFPSLAARQRWLQERLVPEWRRALTEEGPAIVATLRDQQFRGWFAVKDLPRRGIAG